MTQTEIPNLSRSSTESSVISFPCIPITRPTTLKTESPIYEVVGTSISRSSLALVSDFFQFGLLTYQSNITSLVVPYLNRLRRSDAKLFEDETEDEQQQSSSDAERPRSKQERSRLARQALQTYLVDLIRAVVSPGRTLNLGLNLLRPFTDADVPAGICSSVSLP